MRKLISILLVLLTLLSCAVAEETDSAELLEFDLGNFKLPLPSDVVYDVNDGEIVENEDFLTFYQDSETTDSIVYTQKLSVSMNTNVVNFDEFDPVTEALSSNLVETFLYLSLGASVEPIDYSESELLEYGGLPCAYSSGRLWVNCSQMGIDEAAMVYYERYVFSDERFGTYVFNLLTDDPSDGNDPLHEILSSITWSL